MTYTLTPDPNVVIRDADKVSISSDPRHGDRKQYQAWLDAGNTPTPAPPPSKAQQAAAHLAGGLTINFTSGASVLSGRYAVVPPHSHNINALATSLSYDGNAFPNGAGTAHIVTMDGVAMEFDKSSFKLLMRATRDFVHNTNLYVMGVATALPPNVTTKSIEELAESKPA